MVREAHKRGMEVILDVVFNHTAEGNELGPHISFRGIDNRRWALFSNIAYHSVACNEFFCVIEGKHAFTIVCQAYVIILYVKHAVLWNKGWLLNGRAEAFQVIGFKPNRACTHTQNTACGA
jgi:hypothetical protein